jgi:hypothetical protein
MIAAEFFLERRLALSKTPDRVGIDYIEVEASAQAPTRPRLRVYFVPAQAGVNKLSVPVDVPLSAVEITDRSGAEASGVRVVSVTPAADGRPYLQVELSLDDDVLVAASGGELYTFTLRGLARVDPFFSSRQFALTATPATGSATPDRPPVRPAVDTSAPELDYLVKDYASFRLSMLDQLAVLAPTWTEQGPADMGMAIVEVLAYAADYLSYYQDAVATEAYLGTARQRISVRRHARLLGYALHEGYNARCWVQVSVDGDAPVELDRGTPLLTRVAGLGDAALIPPTSRIHADALARGAEVFETLHPTILFKAHNQLSLYTWGAREWVLTAGATRATLAGHLPNLNQGDPLVFQPVDADPRLRHVVRLSAAPALTVDPLYGTRITEIEWFADDALPFDLPVASNHAGRESRDLTVVHGNVVLADHGRSITAESLPAVPGNGRYQPALRRPALVFSQPIDPNALRSTPASAVSVQDPRQTVPAIHLVQHEADGDVEWQAQPDLLRSNRFARDFVVEVDSRGYASLRFGDGILGSQPAPGTTFSAMYRVEGGPRGDVDADSIAYIVADDPRLIGARNPMPALPGLAAEPMDDARVDAPQLLSKPQTCVTETDYAQAAMQHPEVANAVARLLWSGSGYLACIYVQRRAGRAVDGAFSAELERFLEPRLMAGLAVEIRAPHLVPLTIALQVQIDAQYYRSSIARTLAERFGSARLADGRQGYFYPDAFTFGQTVYLSPIVAGVMRVPGVRSVEWLEHGVFQRWGQPSRGELAAGRIDLGPLEIARVASARGAPSLGSISFELWGGR